MNNQEPEEKISHSLFHGLTAGIGCLGGGAAGPGLLYLGILMLDRMQPDAEVGMLFSLLFGVVFLISMPIGAAIGIAVATKFYDAIVNRKAP